MFWALAMLSMLGYTLQGTLMARFVRAIDPLSAGFYRSVTFFISLLPLLFLAEMSEIIGIKDYWLEISIAAILGAAAQWASFWTIRFFPLGIAGAIKMGLFVCFSLLLGGLFSNEILSATQIIAVLFILIGATLLGIRKEKMSHLEPVGFLKGTILLIMTSIFLSVSVFFVAKVARELSPWVSGYFWEIGVAIFAGIFLFFRKITTGQSIEKISPKTFWLIFLTASPTLIGTGCFALAVNYGPVGIVNAISVSGVLISAFLAHFLYGEKLRTSHWGLIVMIIAGVVALKVL